MILSHVKLWQIDIMAFDLWGQGDQKYENQLQPTFLEFEWAIEGRKMEVKVQKLISLDF